MDKYKIDSEIYKLMDDSKNMMHSEWDFMFKDNTVTDEFYNFIISNLTIELKKERHVRYVKAKIKHIVKNCIEDINSDE